jgi:hypothetical protein
VTDRIIGVALERDVRMIPSHPVIERIVEKEIRKHGTNDRPLRRSFLAANQRPIRHQDGRFQPPLHVQQHPRTIGVSSYGPHQKFPIDFIKEAFDIEIQHPVVTPTSLACQR